MSEVSVSEVDGKICLENGLCEIAFDLKDRTWSGRDLTTDAWMFRNARFRVDRHLGQQWREPETDVAWESAGSESRFGAGTTLTITVTPREGYEPARILTLGLYPDRHFVEIGWGVANRLSHPIRVRTVDVLFGGEVFNDQEVEDARTLASGAGAEPNMVTEGWEIDALNGALLTYRDRGARRSIVAGGLAYAEFARRVEIRDGHRTPGRRVLKEGLRNLNLTVWDPQGKLVGPGATYMSPDTLYLDFVTADPFEALEAYGSALAEANDARPNAYDFPTLCGWMVSTKSLGEGKPINNSPGLVEETRLARERGLMKYTPLAVRLEPDTYCYGNHGDTQQGWWDDEHWAAYGPGNGEARGEGKGSLRKPHETFAKFCSAVAELGGVPFTYFQCSMPSNDFAAARPEWMLGNDVSLIHHSHNHHRPLVRYDYSDPGFREHCLGVWRRLRDAGLKGVKFDYPETAWASGGGFDDESFTTTSAYRELFRLCREGLGEDAFLHERNLGGHTHEEAPRLDVTAGIVDIQRVWGDASHFEPEMASRMGLRWYKSRSAFLYYPDGKSFLVKGEDLSAYRRRAFITLIAFLSGRLEIGTSIGSMTDEMLRDLTRVYPVFGGGRSPRPVDMLVGGGHPSVYVYEVAEGWSQVLLVNNDPEGRRAVSAPLSGCQADTGSIGLDPEGRYHAFDFWADEYLGVLEGTGELSRELMGGEVAMVSVRRAEAHPQIVSTNRHIMQGMVECRDVAWSPEDRTLSGTVDVVGGEPFILTIATNGMKAASCEGADLCGRDGGLVELVFESDENASVSFRLGCE